VAGGGRDRGAEFVEAMAEIRETGETDGAKVRRFFDEDGEREKKED
jgi:hypothetical protein